MYQTPAPKQWDEGNSLDSISEGLNELAIGPVLQEVVEEEEDGDPEYMPPHDERESLLSFPVSGVAPLARGSRAMFSQTTRGSQVQSRGESQLIPHLALPYEPVGAVPSCEADVLLITQLPPLWSMAPAWSWGRGQAPSSPELERPIDVCINICGRSSLSPLRARCHLYDNDLVVLEDMTDLGDRRGRAGGTHVSSPKTDSTARLVRLFFLTHPIQVKASILSHD